MITARGPVPIREVVAGEDWVLSRNELSGETIYQPVMDQYSNSYAETVYLTIVDVETGDEQRVMSNRIHPFFAVRPVQAAPQPVLVSAEGHVYRGSIPGGAWIDAADLRVGDRLLNDDESWASVVGVEVTAKHLKAFNLSVFETESFFVAANESSAPVWVHNCTREQARQIRNAHKVAKSGGRHSGEYLRHKDLPTSSVRKAIKSHTRQINLHKDKIRNPRKHVPNWDKLPKQQRDGLLNKKWPADIQRHREHRAIKRGILKERGLSPW